MRIRSQGKLCEILEECTYGASSQVAGEKSARVRPSRGYTVSLDEGRRNNYDHIILI